MWIFSQHNALESNASQHCFSTHLTFNDFESTILAWKKCNNIIQLVTGVDNAVTAGLELTTVTIRALGDGLSQKLHDESSVLSHTH